METVPGCDTMPSLMRSVWLLGIVHVCAPTTDSAMSSMANVRAVSDSPISSEPTPIESVVPGAPSPLSAKPPGASN